MTRRKFLQSAALAAAATPLLPRGAHAQAAAPAKLKGNINHSVCRWCYGKIKLDDLCAAGKEMGLVAIDLLNPPEFETVKKAHQDGRCADIVQVRKIAAAPARAGEDNVTTPCAALD